jgi:hypothetical protein
VSDLTVFCARPAGPAPGSGATEQGEAPPAPGAYTAGTVAGSLAVVSSVASGSTPAGRVHHGTETGRCPTRLVHSPPARAGKSSTTRGLRARMAPGRTATWSQVSSPASSQARLDTRPKGSAGAKGVDGESPLPATDGPPTWVSALGPGGAGSGGSGVAAGISPFGLMPSTLRRVREEAVVRRPASVFAPLDVPV